MSHYYTKGFYKERLIRFKLFPISFGKFRTIRQANVRSFFFWRLEIAIRRPCLPCFCKSQGRDEMFREMQPRINALENKLWEIKDLKTQELKALKFLLSTVEEDHDEGPQESHFAADQLLLKFIDDPEVTELFNKLTRWYE